MSENAVFNNQHPAGRWANLCLIQARRRELSPVIPEDEYARLGD
jgi:hypothetical protein